MSPDPESFSWIRLLLAISVVAGLMALLGLVLKYISIKGLKLPGIVQPSGRLQIVESLALDMKRRLVIIRCDDREHLLLLGTNQDIVVESRPAPPFQTKSTT